LLPRKASPLEKLALVVVLPTPPLPEVTTMTFATCFSSSPKKVPHYRRTGRF
jgi:hypothetical protein